MNPNTKKYLIIGAVAILSFLAIKKWLKSTPKPSQEPNAIQSNVIEPSGVPNKDKFLSKGATGLEVMLLQKQLGNLDVDGIFGDKTEARLKKVKGLSLITLNQLNK
jgi:hypothetical protein